VYIKSSINFPGGVFRFPNLDSNLKSEIYANRLPSYGGYAEIDEKLRALALTSHRVNSMGRLFENFIN